MRQVTALMPATKTLGLIIGRNGIAPFPLSGNEPTEMLAFGSGQFSHGNRIRYGDSITSELAEQCSALRLHGRGNPGVKLKAEAVADILAAIRERRA